MDIEDEYLCSCDFNYNNEQFTDNFYVYEQGVKEIIVKNRLKRHVQFWKDIGASSFIIDTIEHGYKIPFYSLPKSVVLKNNKSALCEKDFVLDAIKDLLEKGLVEKCVKAPIVVNPLSVSVQIAVKRD